MIDFLNHEHLSESIKIFEFISQIDFAEAEDYFCWKHGGDGDNGEVLMNELDEYFKRNKVDAVEVVRCKDCKYAQNAYIKSVKNISKTEKYCVIFEDRFNNNDFCSHGERKEKHGNQGFTERACYERTN